MIRSFYSKDTERVFHREFTNRFPADVVSAARRKLEILNAAGAIEDLRVPPGNRLEKLAGDREGQYSIRVNDKWRICFRWLETGVYEVELVDYH